MHEVHPAQGRDIDDLVRLHAVLQDWHARHYPKVFKPAPDNMDGFFTDILRDPDCRIWLSAAGDGVACGYLFARIATRGESAFAHARKRLMIEHIAVAGGTRRQGHGAALIAAARAEALREGCDELTLDTWAENTGAQAFFRSMGLLPQRLWFAQSL
ncbi:GNAT family N-acetyltransferase [Oceaniglobus trochenteri]|uniref:GNAT family N-acetyltransferase n=1 Tax=Oceaniglobus trochenteri TaxID=2763260 RepID=UPI001CFF6D3F|nr:GNAT family N-acetyltransferase [Oceaniglobus trochenteri]